MVNYGQFGPAHGVSIRDVQSHLWLPWVLTQSLVFIVVVLCISSVSFRHSACVIMPKSSKAARSLRRRGRPSLALDNGNFGLSLSSQATTQYMGNDSATGAVTTKRELGIVLNDYFDYNAIQPGAGNVPQFVTHYWWDNGQNLFDTDPAAPAGVDSTFCRVRKVEVWVLPQARGLTVPPVGQIRSVTNADQMYTVSCQVPGTTFQPSGQSPPAKAFAANTQVTNVLPQFDTKWKKVLTCDLQKTFQSAVMSPVFSPFVSGEDVKRTNQCLFSMSILNPTNGKTYLTGSEDDPDESIRVRVQLTLDQPISTSNQARLATFRNEDFSLPFTGQNGPDFPGTTAQYVQADLRSVMDHFR